MGSSATTSPSRLAALALLLALAAAVAPALSATPAQQDIKIERLLENARKLEASDGPGEAYRFLDSFEQVARVPQIVFAKGVYAIGMRSYELAERHLRDYIKLEPDSSWGYNTLGYMLADNNTRLDEALKLIERALEIEPNSPAIVDSHAWVLYRLDQPAAALRRMEEAVRLSGHNPSPEMLAHLGELLWENGKKEQAVKIWRAAWQMDPRHDYLTRTIERYAKDRLY